MVLSKHEILGTGLVGGSLEIIKKLPIPIIGEQFREAGL